MDTELEGCLRPTEYPMPPYCAKIIQLATLNSLYARLTGRKRQSF